MLNHEDNSKIMQRCNHKILPPFSHQKTAPPLDTGREMPANTARTLLLAFFGGIAMGRLAYFTSMALLAATLTLSISGCGNDTSGTAGGGTPKKIRIAS